MPDQASVSALVLPLSETGCHPACSELEQEVVRLFEQFRGPLLRYLYSLGLRTHDGEELIQDVFLALFQHLRKGRSRRNLRGWLFRVAHNLALKRRLWIRRDLESTLEFRWPAEKTAADPRPNPEDQCARSQRHERLRAIVNALPAQDRRCLALRAEGLRYREIAQVLAMSLGAVAISLERSLARISRAVER